MRTTQILTVSFTLLFLAMTTSAQDTSNNDTQSTAIEKQTAILTAETALLNATKAKLVAEQDLAQQQLQPKIDADTKQSEREKALTDLVAKLGENAGTVPSGGVTSAAGVVQTPVTTALALRAAESIAGDVAKSIVDVTGSKTLIFVDAMPSPADALSLQYWVKTADDLLASKVAMIGASVRETPTSDSEKVVAQSATLAAASVLIALPSAVNGIAGLFRTDYDEKTGDAAIEKGGVESLVIQNLLTSESPKPAAIYRSLDAYVWAQSISPQTLTVYEKIIDLIAAQKQIAQASANVVDLKAKKEAELNDYKAKISGLNTTLSTLKTAILGEEEKEIMAPDAERPLHTKLKQLFDNRLVNAKAELAQRSDPAKKLELEGQVAEHAAAGSRLSSLLGEFTAFISETLGVDPAKGPKLVTLMREEMVQRVCFPAPDPSQEVTMGERSRQADLAFVTIAVSQKPQSVIEKKSVWLRSYVVSALLGVDFEIYGPDGRIAAAGHKWKGFVQPMPKPDGLEEI